MGATSALLYCVKYHPTDVILQIIDSPFYSFEMIAFEIANKNVKAPEFIISFALQMAKKNCTKFQYNPFQIQLNNVGQCTVPALFVYCEEDNVINSRNTQLICAKYKGIFEKLVIQQNHNTVRTPSTVEKIYSFIDKYSKKPKARPPTALSGIYYDYKSVDSNRYGMITPTRKVHSKAESSFDESSDKKSSGRRGIERVILRENKGKRFDDYGIWVASKFQGEMPQTPQHNANKSKNGPEKRSHLSLSSSMTNKHIKGMDSNLSPSFFKQQHFREPFYQSNAKTTATQKERTSKKISTIKSLGVSRFLNNSKYL